MDLVTLARDKVEALPEGDYTIGLRAVLLHIETAIGHLHRGQKDEAETAFTDAIYRTNQAFEGSLKEAYRVLAKKKPEKKSPYQIEEYLTAKNVFRKRVLDQLTSYRTEWRNPSTHDYKLDFDSSEALLAIVSVSAFAILLFDQITEEIARTSSAEAAEKMREEILSDVNVESESLRRYVSALLGSYIRKPLMGNDQRPRSESELMGSIAGFLESVADGIAVGVQMPLGKYTDRRADLLVQRGDERVIVEIRHHETNEDNIQMALAQLEHLAEAGGIADGILVAVSDAMFVSFEEVDSSKGHHFTVIREGSPRADDGEIA